VGEKIFEIDNLPEIVDGDNQPIAIAFDIEDCEISNCFSRRISLLNFG
jgi:hypothetical protein